MDLFEQRRWGYCYIPSALFSRELIVAEEYVSLKNRCVSKLLDAAHVVMDDRYSLCLRLLAFRNIPNAQEVMFMTPEC